VYTSLSLIHATLYSLQDRLKYSLKQLPLSPPTLQALNLVMCPWLQH